MSIRTIVPKLATLFVLILAAGSILPDCTKPEELCLTIADIAAKTEVRCNPELNYDEQKQKFIDLAALGSCKTVKKIRDIDALTNDCLPWIESVSCSVLAAGRQLPACENQLLLK
jgi:hypothetical protein